MVCQARRIGPHDLIASFVSAIAEVTAAAFETLEISNHTEQYIIAALRRVVGCAAPAKRQIIAEGSIVNLSQFADNTFDATLCLGGPLSHVLDAHKRDMAISELIRVTKKGAPIIVSVMGRLSLLVIELTLFQNEIEMPHFEQIRDTGDYTGGSGFTACHFFLPEELRATFGDRGVTIVDMVGLEGISAHHAEKLNQLAKDEKRWKIWLETHYRTCTHPSVVGMSEHLMIICRKSSGSALL
jgi:SAM-dependent methyltransferase